MGMDGILGGMNISRVTANLAYMRSDETMR